MSSPQITTYGADMDSLVKKSIAIILEKIADRSFSVGRVLVPGTMIERQSVCSRGDRQENNDLK